MLLSSVHALEAHVLVSLLFAQCTNWLQLDIRGQLHKIVFWGQKIIFFPQENFFSPPLILGAGAPS